MKLPRIAPGGALKLDPPMPTHDPDPRPAPPAIPPRLGPITRLSTIDSTNEEAFRALAEGRAQPGHVWIAEEQTAGRGRRGKSWWSAPGEGLYLSAIWAPQPRPAAPLVTMACGLAVLHALRSAGVDSIALKWPNDVLHGKLAGILVESRTGGALGGARVVGIGLNLFQTQVPAALRAEQAVTSLALLGYRPERAQIEALLLDRLGFYWALAQAQPQALCHAYWEASPWTDGPIAVETGGAVEHGRALRLDAERGLAFQPEVGPERWLRLEAIQGLRALSS